MSVSLLYCAAGHLLLLAKTVKFKSNSVRFVLLLVLSCDCKQTLNGNCGYFQNPNLAHGS